MDGICIWVRLHIAELVRSSTASVVSCCALPPVWHFDTEPISWVLCCILYMPPSHTGTLWDSHYCSCCHDRLIVSLYWEKLDSAARQWKADTGSGLRGGCLDLLVQDFDNGACPHCVQGQEGIIGFLGDMKGDKWGQCVSFCSVRWLTAEAQFHYERCLIEEPERT